MDQQTKWQQTLEKLQDTVMDETNMTLFETYQGALRDIKKQAKRYLDEYETLTFAQRLEAERLLDIGEKVKGILDKANGTVTNAIKAGTAEQATLGYYGTFYALEGAENINIPVSILNENYIEKIVNQPVDGKTLSKRLYQNRDKLAKTTTRSIIQGAIDGKGYAYVAKRIADQTESTYKRALRIARTEGGRVSSLSTQKAYEDAEKAGVGLQKRWLSTLDKKTRHSHRDLDGQTVGIDEDFTSPATGATGQGPRLMGRASEDINCRCTTIAIVDGIEPGLRRDNESKEMIQSMTYNEWLQFKGINGPANTATSKATEAEFKEFKSVRETVDYGVKSSKKWQNRLTKAERDAMEQYTDLSNDINGYAREGDDYFKRLGIPVSKRDQIKQQFKAVESALDKANLDDNLVLFRGTNAKALNLTRSQLNDDVLDAMIGKTITEKGFMSTTGTKRVAETYGNDIILRINAPQGSKAAFVDAIQDISDYEDGDFNLEFLFQRKQSMEITGYRKTTGQNGKAYYEIDVDLLTKGKRK